MKLELTLLEVLFEVWRFLGAFQSQSINGNKVVKSELKPSCDTAT